MGHISGITPSKKTDSLSSRSQRVSLAPHPGVGLMGPCTLGSRSSVAGMWRGMQWCSGSVPTRRLVQLCLPTPGLWNSTTLFAVMLPNPLRKKGYFDQLWIFPLTKIHCTEKLPWWGLRAVLIYGDGDVDLEDCWVLYSLIKMTVESSVLRLMSFLTIVGQIYSSGHGYCRGDLSTLNSVQEVLVTPIIFMSLLHTLAYLVGRVIMAVHTPHSWVGLLMPFPPIIYHSPSWYCEHQPGESFLVTTNSTWLIPVLWPKHVVSSAIGSHHQVLVHINSRTNSLYCLGCVLGLLCWQHLTLRSFLICQPMASGRSTIPCEGTLQFLNRSKISVLDLKLLEG